MRWIACLLLLLGTMPAVAGWALKEPGIDRQSGGVTLVTKQVSDGSRMVTLHLALFQTPRHRLHVVDDPDGLRVRDAVRAVDGIAGVNGGYFHPDNQPAGLVVSGGRRIQGMERARLLSGVVAATADRLFVLRRDEFRLGPKTQNAIQSGPFLIDRGKVITGLHSSRPARRTAILSDAKNRHALLVSDSVTLPQLAEILATPGVITEFPLARALNLDGGTSSGFYFQGGAHVPNVKPVRNCLVIRKDTR